MKLTTAGLDAPGISKEAAALLHAIRGEAHLSAEEFDAAAIDFNSSIDASADVHQVCSAVGNVFLLRGTALFWQRHFRDSQEDFRRALVCEPKSPVAWFKLGTANFAMHDERSAVTSFSEAISLKPGYQDALKGRGNSYENLGEFDNSLADYSEVLRRDPNNAPTYNNRATIYTAQGRLDEAIIDYDRALALTPSNFMIALNRAYLHFWKNDYAGAREDLKLAKALHDDPKVWADFEKLYGAVFAKRREADMADLDERLANTPN